MTISPNKWELDVQSYLNVCNITSATPRKQIRDFSAGVNDLGLWTSMVCWPLRSSQNYGSGTTAFSLGGLATFNGTLVNGPTWETYGIQFTAGPPSQAVTIGSLFNDTNHRFLFGCGRATVSSEGNGAIASWQNSPGIGIFPSANKTAVFGGDITKDNFGTLAVSQRVFVGFSASSTSMTSFRDVATTDTTAGTLTSQSGSLVLGRYADGNAELTGDISIVIAGKGQALNLAQYQQLYTLYKDTLGTGLGLP